MAQPADGAPPRSWVRPAGFAASVLLLVGFGALMARTASRQPLEYVTLFLLTVFVPLNWAGGHATATGRRRALMGVGVGLELLGTVAFAGCELWLAVSGR